MHLWHVQWRKPGGHISRLQVKTLEIAMRHYEAARSRGARAFVGLAEHMWKDLV